MEKVHSGDLFYYFPETRLTLDDIVELYHIFKNVTDAFQIQVNDWRLHDISEITRIKEPITNVKLSVDSIQNDFWGTYLNIANSIVLRLSDKDDIRLLGLKSKFEEVLDKREHPRPSIIQDTTKSGPPKHDDVEVTIKAIDTISPSVEKGKESSIISFLKRNKDDIIVGLIVGIIILVVGVIAYLTLGIHP